MQLAQVSKFYTIHYLLFTVLVRNAVITHINSFGQFIHCPAQHFFYRYDFFIAPVIDNANRSRYLDVAVGCLERTLIDTVSQALDRGCLVVIHVRVMHQHCKMVAIQFCDGVGRSYRPSQAPLHPDQHFIGYVQAAVFTNVPELIDLKYRQAHAAFA